jgi:AcrR family transcriptional regulator
MSAGRPPGAESPDRARLQVRRVPHRKRGNAAETRSNLIASAKRLAETKNVSDITVEDIALGANVSRAAFYMHFEHKTEICLEVAATSQTALLEAARSFERGPDLNGTIESGVRAFIEGFNRDRSGLRMLYDVNLADRSLVYDLRGQLYELWESEFRAGLAQAPGPQTELPIVTRLLVGMLETFCVRTMRPHDYLNTDVESIDAASLITELWRRCLQLS